MFTPHAPLNRVPSGCSTGVESERYFTGACPARPVECETYSSGVGSENRTGVNSFSACLGGRNDRISVECLNLVHQGVVIPLGFTPWNPFSACLRAPREIHISDSAAYFTGVVKSDRIGRARLDSVNQGHAIPPGFGDSLKKYPIKLHHLKKRVEFFSFPTPWD